MLGIGDAGVRRIPVNDALQMEIAALRSSIEDDLAAGRRPIAVIGTAGTVGTGAIDPLDALADVCDAYGLWFHVDGAYGGAAALVSSLRPRFAGIERADSVGFDAHKWLYTPLPGACILVRDPRNLAAAYAVAPEYTRTDHDYTGWGVDLYELSPHFSRAFSALKIWVSFLAHGWYAYERRIAHDIDLAAYLWRRADSHPELEPMGPEPELSIACYRFVPSGLDPGSDREAYLDRLNERVMLDLQLDGRVFPSNARVDGKFALRACIVNYRTEADTIDTLVEATIETGRRADSEARPGARG
jgi:glutamate/tyrosine decarboxylase-like PLP-dependent enzyme